MAAPPQRRTLKHSGAGARLYNIVDRSSALEETFYFVARASPRKRSFWVALAWIEAESSLNCPLATVRGISVIQAAGCYSESQLSHRSRRSLENDPISLVELEDGAPREEPVRMVASGMESSVRDVNSATSIMRSGHSMVDVLYDPTWF